MAQPNLLTRYKLSRARSDPARCLAALAGTGMQYDALPDRTTGEGCGFSNAVRLRTAAVRIGAPLSLSCPMALSFFMWERHALQPAAQLHMGQRVAGIDHLGSYACRDVNRGEGAPPNAPARARSRHATANALDISAFTLASGKRITVLKDWPDEDATCRPAPRRCCCATPTAAPANTSRVCWAPTTTPCTVTTFTSKPAATACAGRASHKFLRKVMAVAKVAPWLTAMFLIATRCPVTYQPCRRLHRAVFRQRVVLGVLRAGGAGVVGQDAQLRADGKARWRCRCRPLLRARGCRAPGWRR
jgi:hypothetical protein